MKYLIILALTLFASATLGQDIEYDVETVKIVETVKQKTLKEFTLRGTVLNSEAEEKVISSKEVEALVITIDIDLPEGVSPQIKVKSRSKESLRSKKVQKLEDNQYIITEPGEYLVDVEYIALVDGNIVWDEIEFLATLGPRPPPIDPVDPDPVDPVDPDPVDPDFDASPFKSEGLKVLIVFESATKSSLPAQQLQILYSPALSKRLQELCVFDEAQHPSWRIQDVDTPMVPDSVFNEPMGEGKPDTLPWIYIGDGTVGYSGPLPGTVEETLEIINKFEKFGR